MTIIVQTDGRIFFIDHNSRATQWDDPRMTDEKIAGPAIPYNRDYKRKYDYLKTQMKKPSNVPTKFEIKVRRQHVMEDSYRFVHWKIWCTTGQTWKTEGLHRVSITSCS